MKEEEEETYNRVRGIILFAHDPWNPSIEVHRHFSSPGRIGLSRSPLIPFLRPELILNLRTNIAMSQYNQHQYDYYFLIERMEKPERG